mgnify:CR=1 FL=1
MSYTKKEVQTFAAKANKLEKDAGTELSRQGALAAAISLRKGWGEDDLTKNGEARKFFMECLETRGVKVTPQSIERYTLSAHPHVVKMGFDKLMAAAYPIQEKHDGSRINNIQEAMLREARTGVSFAKVKAVADAKAKDDAAAHATRTGTTALATRADLVKALNASIKRKLVMCYEKDIAEAIYAEVCVRAADLGKHKFKAKKKK